MADSTRRAPARDREIVRLDELVAADGRKGPRGRRVFGDIVRAREDRERPLPRKPGRRGKSG